MSVQGLILPNTESLKLQKLLQREYVKEEFSQLLSKWTFSEKVSFRSQGQIIPYFELPRGFSAEVFKVIHCAILERVFELTFDEDPTKLSLSLSGFSFLPGETLPERLYKDLARSVTDMSILGWDLADEYADDLGSFIFEYLGVIYLGSRLEYNQIFHLLSEMMRAYVPTQGIFPLGFTIAPQTASPVLMYTPSPGRSLIQRSLSH